MAPDKRSMQAQNKELLYSVMQVYLRKIFNFFMEFGQTNPIIRAVLYWVIVIIGSLIHDFHPPPKTYFSNSGNIFNAVFVKFGLAWTLVTVTPFLVLSSLMKSEGKFQRMMLYDASRILIAVAVWFLVTGVFGRIEEMTGVCEGSELFSSKDACLADGLLWRGFDTSGHCFLLAYLSLMLSEEMQGMSFWNDEDLSTTWKRRFRFAQPVASFLYVCCCLLMLLWEVMLVFTALYFHSVESKIIGVLFGLFSWMVTYKYLFGYLGISLQTEC